jgi:hypothetical protein
VYLKAIMSGSAALVDYELNTNNGDIVQVNLQPNAQMARLVNGRFNEYAAALSPDGHWLAYQSNESGRPEIYVRDLSAAGARTPVSTDSGEEPHWSHDGRELFYRKQGSFMSVDCETNPNFRASTPRELFKGVFDLRSTSGVTYDVDPKGGRFLMIRPAAETTAATTMKIVLNWFDELRRVVPK